MKIRKWGTPLVEKCHNRDECGLPIKHITTVKGKNAGR